MGDITQYSLYADAHSFSCLLGKFILANFVVRLEFNQNRGFLQLNKLTSKEKSCDLKLELVTMLLWLVENKTKKQNTDLKKHSATKNK